jgi:adenylylsulfate kinase
MTGVVVWLTGLPAAGKTTLARAIHARLAVSARPGVVLDGDDLRGVLGVAGHHEAARNDFYARLSALAAYVADQGLVAIVAATAHRRAYRDAARARAPHFVEVHVATPLPTCEARDPKRLYARARAGDAPALPGVGVAYEPPVAPAVVPTRGDAGNAVHRVVELCLAAMRP